MSAGRSADGREVQIPLQQVAPSLTTPLSVVPPIPQPSHRQANPWPPSDPTASQGKHLKHPHHQLVPALRCDWLGVLSSGVSVFRILISGVSLCLGVPAGFLPLHGGFRDHFVETPEAKYCCEACRLVLCQPRQTECGHRFCQSCIKDILR